MQKFDRKTVTNENFTNQNFGRIDGGFHRQNIKRENFDETLAIHQNFTVKLLRYTTLLLV